jgi:hypothetical protein
VTDAFLMHVLNGTYQRQKVSPTKIWFEWTALSYVPKQVASTTILNNNAETLISMLVCNCTSF